VIAWCKAVAADQCDVLPCALRKVEASTECQEPHDLPRVLVPFLRVASANPAFQSSVAV
jgi:hypothetical protein